MIDELSIRVHGDESRPTLIYLPGTHGDWTLNGGFRRALGDRARLVEFTFPRTLSWSLEDYARLIEEKLLETNIKNGWILAESFASQVVWAWMERQSEQFRIEGIILAGGFVRHPIIPAVRLARELTRTIPMPVLRAVVWFYAVYARARESNSPEIQADLREFAHRRTKADMQAAAHRLDLIIQNDLRPGARACSLPVFYLTGFFDPIVPWPLVIPWLRKNCPGYKDWKLTAGSDHHVLGSARAACDAILLWIARFAGRG